MYSICLRISGPDRHTRAKPIRRLNAVEKTEREACPRRESNLAFATSMVFERLDQPQPYSLEWQLRGDLAHQQVDRTRRDLTSIRP